MSVADLTPDQKRLLILISRFSRPARNRNEKETWIKKIPLMALISRGIQRGTFKDYDYAPTMVDYMGSVRYANISKEGEDDVADLREEGLVNRLKLATSHHVYVSAYRVTRQGMRALKGLEKEHHTAVKDLISCGKCKGAMSIEAKEDAPYLICGNKRCKRKKKVDIFDIEDVPYVSSPVYSNVWLPPD